jgi:hypothetical protein
MAVVKVIETIAESPKNWKAANAVTVAEAVKTVHNITSVYVDSQQAIVENDKIVRYHVATYYFRSLISSDRPNLADKSLT